jgi:uncharacterized membrane protein YfcA
VTRPRRDPVDVVALVLAASLGATVLMILIATTVQILNSSFPQVTLSENATQVLIAGVGGLTGLIGAYIGVRARRVDPHDPP